MSNVLRAKHIARCSSVRIILQISLDMRQAKKTISALVQREASA